MLTSIANGNSRPTFWPRVREFAVPPSMIETATARRAVGDWAGACAAAGIDVDLHPRSAARAHGSDFAARLRADLRHLAPDLLRWHMPRIAPDGLLRPGLTVALARYEVAGRDGVYPVRLVVRTPPAWADAGQRISLALWDGSRSGAGARGHPHAHHHPHPHPDRRFRLDLHRHLWDARRTDEFRVRSGAGPSEGGPSEGGPSEGGPSEGGPPPTGARHTTDPAVPAMVPPGSLRAVGRWGAEAGILLRAEGRSTGAFTVRFGAGRRLDLELVADRDGVGRPVTRLTTASTSDVASALPVLPDAATWVPPDLELIRAGLIDAGLLHPLVASALVPDHVPSGPSRSADRTAEPRVVECRGVQHRIGLVDGVLAALDHSPDEIRREELLAALSGSPLPCLRVIDEAHRSPDCLSAVRERLDHGDAAGALAVVERLLGPDALLRGGALRDELEAAAERRIAYGLFRTGMAGPGPRSGRNLPGDPRPRDLRSRPRDVTRR